jgi:hypothetical protein
MPASWPVTGDGRRSGAGESAACPTDVKEVVTLLGQSKQLRFTTRGDHVARGTFSRSVVFKPCRQGQLSAPWHRFVATPA